MKKSLLALAVLGAFTGAASAQSSVTIYGLVDLGLYKANDGTAANPGVPQGAGNDSWAVAQAAGSRLGFRGTEDLGGGLSAQFQIEHRFSPDTGAQGNANAFWQGRSYVQVTSKDAGSIYLGRDYTPAFWPAVKSDPFGWDGVGQIGGQAWAGYLSPDQGQGAGVRSSNTLGYKSPNLGGLTIQAAVALSEGPLPGRNTGFNVEYGAGPLYAAMGYEKINGDGAPADGTGTMNFALHYDFGVAKVMGYYNRASVGPNGDATNTIFSIGARIPAAGGVVKAQYYNRKNDDDSKLSKIGIGYDYPLSKRTNVYADAGFGKQDGADNRSAFALGVKHTF